MIQENIRNVLSKNKNRLGISAGGIVIFLLLVYIDRPYRIKDILRGEALLILGVTFIGIYTFLTAVYFGLVQKHEGWKRVTILLAFVGGLIGGYVAYDGYGFRLRDFLQMVIGFGIGVTITVALVVASRRLIVWIHDGFQKN